MKVAVVGSRDFPYLIAVWRLVVNLLPANAIIVSGGARGVDRVAEKAARARGLPEPIIFIPKWDLLGKRAGFIRNETIIQEADLVIAFWYKRSRGTADSLMHARRMGKRVIVFEFINGHIRRCPEY